MKLILAISIFTLGGFLLSRMTRRNDVADTLWGLGFVLVGALYFPGFPLSTLKSNLVFTFLVLWGLRLALHIGYRSFRKKTEDTRYLNWRKEWGRTEPIRAFFQVFLLQGIILGIVSLPLVFVFQNNSAVITPIDFLGMTLFVIGFLFESTADLELALFKKKPSETLLTTGIWGFSRHPNYFGEILIWFGFACFSFSLPWGWTTLVSPVLILFLLMKVSGVPMLEALLEKKGAAFELYLKQTPALLPIRRHHFASFLKIITALITLDALWLGWIMQSFYLRELSLVARIQNGSWDTLYWALPGVYLLLAFGIQFFCTHLALSRIQSAFKGALLGLVIYGVYEYTNLALVKNWSMSAALIDILWGVILCSVAGALGWGKNEA